MENHKENFNGLAINIEDLTKFYGTARGIENVNLQVRSGSVYGFLGPNGSGKTTTIRILVGLLRQTSGYAEIFGVKAGTMESKQLIGYLPSDFELYRHYTVKEYLDYIEKIRGSAAMRDSLVEHLELDIFRKTGELSRGNKQKVGIVQALMHEPKLLIADEPTTGLDPLMQERFDKVIREFVNRGNTAFISSHILSEVQTICDEVSVIRDGQIVSSGSIEVLLKNLPRKATLQVVSGTDINKLVESLGVQMVGRSSDKVSVIFEGTPMEFAAKLRDNPVISDITIPEPDLEEYFMSFYTGGKS